MTIKEKPTYRGMRFENVLRSLKPVDDLDHIDLYHEGEYIDRLPGEDGSAQGSFKVYANILDFADGVVDLTRSLKGMDLFAEHTGDADRHPGKHPNIDRLFEVADQGYDLSARMIWKD